MGVRAIRFVGFPVLLGVGGAMLVYALMFPFECGGTDVGSPPGGPDMNDYHCDSILLHSPDPAGSLKGPTPGSDPDTKTGLDVLQTQMMLRGSAVAVVPVMVGLGVGWWLGTRRPPQDRESVHKRRLSAVARPACGVAVAGAIVGSILGATWLLNDPVAMLPLAISLAAPLVVLMVRSTGIWVV